MAEKKFNENLCEQVRQGVIAIYNTDKSMIADLLHYIFPDSTQIVHGTSIFYFKSSSRKSDWSDGTNTVLPFNSVSDFFASVPPVKDVEIDENLFDTTYSALQYAGQFVDENMLFKGLYFTKTPALYDANDSLEDLIKRHSELIGKYMPGSPADVYVQNLKQCKLVKVKVSILT